MDFEAQTLYRWILTAATGGKRDRHHPSHGTQEDLKLEKKPLPRLNIKLKESSPGSRRLC